MRQRNFLGLGSDEAIGAGPASLAGAPQALAKTVLGWNQFALRAIRATRPGTLPAAQALALLHTCLYNAWAAYDDDARQTVHGVAVRLPRSERSAASKTGAMSHAAHLVLCQRFPAQRAAFDGGMAVLGLDPAQPADQFSPAGIGRTQATSMLELCQRDGAAPFALASSSQPGPPAPAVRSFDSQPGRWYRLAQQISRRDGYDDDQDVLLYFVLANALADAAFAARGLDEATVDGACDAAAAEALRSFTGGRLGAGMAIDGADGQELGRQAGAQVFSKARRYWQGRL